MTRIPSRDGPPAPPSVAEPSAAEPVSLISFSTDAVPSAQRLDYWHSGVLRLLDSGPLSDTAVPFHARLTRLEVADTELLDHAGNAMVARRDAARCRADQRDDISVNFIVLSTSSNVVHGATKRALRTGDMIILDSSQPTEMKRKKHRAISLFIPRAQVSTVCPDPAGLAGRLMRTHGIAGILRAHLQATMDHAAQLQPAQHVMAMEVAVQMALAAISDEVSAPIDAAALDEGVYQAAQSYIAQECTSLGLNPLQVATHLGCSRAGLYRAFAKHGETVSACIWLARVQHARWMLASNRYLHLQIGEIAYRSGFADHSTFNRMFKRAFGMNPADLREVSKAPQRSA